MKQLENLLNPNQLEAVNSIFGPVLVLAGAGSGKTRVITYRTLNLLQKGIEPSSILSVTFTNKAAREMKERIAEILGKRIRNLSISTFHSFGLQVLREHGELVGLKRNFSVYDQTDVFSVLKQVVSESHIRWDYDIGKLSQMISKVKKSSPDTENPTDEENEVLLELYNEYSEHLLSYNAVDFDDLIVKPVKIFEEHPDVLSIYHDRLKFFMVDEFQDTSAMQYKLVKQLASETKNICVVGDDDQSIYSWRGAQYRNILNFEVDFPGAKKIKLEENYRSTRTILQAANELIKNNTSRTVKFLRSVRREDHPIVLHYPENEREEGKWIVEKIRSLSLKYALKLHDFAVLVRTNNQMRGLEEAFLRENIPYRVSGGTSFFQRREIKDILSYLKVMANPDDDSNLLRIINTPRRGLGRKTIKSLLEISDRESCSIYSSIALLRSGATMQLDGRVIPILLDFIALLDYYREKLLSGKKMWKTLESLIEKIGYYDHLISEYKKPQTVKWKYENILSLVSSLREYEKDPDTVSPDIYDYLSKITLTTSDEADVKRDEKVNIMTIHAAKGLEFEAVFISGLEKGILPHFRTDKEDLAGMEEERRLFYVAITRAKKWLYLTSLRKRRKQGKETESIPSPFLDEIPKELLSLEESEGHVSSEDAVNYFDNIRKVIEAKN